MDWSSGSRVSFLQTQLFPVCQTLAAKGTILMKMRVDSIKRAFIYIQEDFFQLIKINFRKEKFSYKFHRMAKSIGIKKVQSPTALFFFKVRPKK